MLLCQLCGLPLDTDFVLEDEDKELQVPTLETQPDGDVNLRPELRLLESAVELSRQGEKLALAPYLPHVGLVAGYTFSNPNVFNGFEQKVGGFWNVGVMIHVPVWNWMEGKFKVRAAKTSTLMAQTTLDEAREKIDLQVNQCDYRLKEANKKLVTAQKNIQRAEENLRCANVGFKEGVMDATEVMAAQTAWLQAKTQKIDAQIDVCLGEAAMKKAIGVR
jgi:outer membrane protein TolC